MIKKGINIFMRGFLRFYVLIAADSGIAAI